MNYDFNNEIKEMDREIKELNTSYNVGSSVRTYAYTYRYDNPQPISSAYDYYIYFEYGEQPIIVDCIGYTPFWLEPDNVNNRQKFHAPVQAPTTFVFLSTRPIIKIERAGGAS